MKIIVIQVVPAVLLAFALAGCSSQTANAPVAPPAEFQQQTKQSQAKEAQASATREAIIQANQAQDSKNQH